METHSRDGAPQEPIKMEKDKRWPLEEVCFISPTKIPGISTMLTTLEAGIMRLVDGKQWYPPGMWYDPVNRLISIEGASYPMERVHYFRRARAAITKKPLPLKLDAYRVGKRAT